MDSNERTSALPTQIMNTDHSSLQSLHLYFHLFKWPTALVNTGNTRETDGQKKEAGKHRAGETVSKRTKLQKLKRTLKHTPSLVRMLRFSSFSLFFSIFILSFSILSYAPCLPRSSRCVSFSFQARVLRPQLHR